ncbi:hypothetical protein [Tanapox virus]|uniref:Uncharacterized protein 24L n=1 Tax=Tanapox virus TaxID=99000 RepID=A7XCD2_9POXV|nr:hypothetical protein [Tanapox virus]ABQ43652.1 hypothetical protein [Tanapox virus]
MTEIQRVNTLYDLFIEKYLQRLSLHSVPTNINCGIHIGEVNGELKRCNLRIINKCLNNPRLSFILMIESFLEVIDTLPEREKKEIADELGIDINAGSKIISELERKCNASSDVNNIINIQSFNAGNCIAPENTYILLQVINTGSAESNCGLEAILKSMNKRYIQENKIINKLPLSEKPWFIICVVVIFMVFVIAISSLRRKIGFRYKYGSFLYV